MGAAAKIVLGIIVLLIGLALFASSNGKYLDIPVVSQVDWWGSFLTIVAGVIPILLIVIGLFVVWLEADELKTSKEFKKEKK